MAQEHPTAVRVTYPVSRPTYCPLCGVVVPPELLFFRDGVGICEACVTASHAEYALARTCLESLQLQRDRMVIRGLILYSPRGPQILSAVGLWAFRGGMHRRYKTEVAAANAIANSRDEHPRTPPPTGEN